MIVVMSLWRNDAARGIAQRIDHLLSKQTFVSDQVRYIWAVGDSSDETEAILRGYAGDNIEVVRYDSGHEGADALDCRRRTSHTATEMFKRVRISDEHACLHESDLKTPQTVLATLSELCRRLGPVAGWPVIDLGKGHQFYDTWAYRHLDGRRFLSTERRPGLPFNVSSFGSVWMAPAALVRNRSLHPSGAVVDLCGQWRDESVQMWVDPSITVVQPRELWSPL